MSYNPIVTEQPSVNLDFNEVTKIRAEKGALTALTHLATKMGVKTNIEVDSERASVKLEVRHGNVSIIIANGRVPGSTYFRSSTSGGKTIDEAAEDYFKSHFETADALHSIQITKTDEAAIDAWFKDPANKGQPKSPDFKTSTVFKVAPSLNA